MLPGSSSRQFSSGSSSSTTAADEPSIGGDASTSTTSSTDSDSGTGLPPAGSGTDYVYGTVRNYLRQKAFGFVIPDGGTEAEAIFVHRSGIKSTKFLPSSSSTTTPFLLSKERVRFRIVSETTTTSQQQPTAMNPRRGKKPRAGPSQAAQDLEFEDGTQIPIYRPSYVINCKKYALSNLGESVFQAMEEEGVDPAVREAKIKGLFEQSQQIIGDAQARYDAMTLLIKQMS
jgi:'Cold-shock' DNA-binding domain